jgi:hypothetical protein
MPTLNPLEWGGLWLYGSLLLFVLLWAWQGCVKAARWLGRRMDAAEQRRDGACDSCGCEGFYLTYSPDHGAWFCDGCMAREEVAW